MNVDAEEFIPSTYCTDQPLLGFEECGQSAKGWQNLGSRIAREFAYASLEEFGQTYEGWQMLAGRMGNTFNIAADEFVPRFHTISINPAYLSDDGDDESMIKEDPAGIDGDNESSQGSNESVVDAFEDIVGTDDHMGHGKESLESAQMSTGTEGLQEKAEEVLRELLVKEAHKASSD